MYGFPHSLKTRADFENMHAMAVAGDASKEEAKCRWQALIDGQYVWVFDKVLAESTAPDGEEPAYRVVVHRDEGTEERHQFKRVAVPGLLQEIGYSESDAMAKIDELEVTP